MPEEGSPVLYWISNLSENERFYAKHRRSRSSTVLGKFVFSHNINKINHLRLSKMPKKAKGELFLLTFEGFYGMMLKNEKKKKL